MNPTAPEIIVHLPDAISWWPLALGWWITLAVLIALMLFAYKAIRQFIHRRKPKRAALARLQQIQADFIRDQDPQRLIQALSYLLRQTAITYFGSARMAGLTGDAWLTFLNQYSKDASFSTPPANCLATQPYQKIVDMPDVEPLLQQVRNWIISASKDLSC